MNCRIVEHGVFPKGVVKKILTPNFVEARIHTDLPASHPNGGLNSRIAAIRAGYLGAGNIGLPHYIIVDPADPYRKILHLSRASNDEKVFVRFFNKALERVAGQ